MQPAFSLEAKTLRRAFDRAARTFDAAAILHREVRQRMLARLDLVSALPDTILDVGSATGHAARLLGRKFPRARIYAIDSSLAMLQEGKRQLGAWQRFMGRGPLPVCADARSLPFSAASMDWIFSNLMLPSCDAPDEVLAEMRRVLKPRGVFAFSSLGPDTLREFRQAWRRVDDREHIHAFLDMHDLGDALVRAGFAEPVLDVERFTFTYRDVAALLRDLRDTGSINGLQHRGRGLRGRSLLAALELGYEEFRVNGVLPATVEVVYGHAWQSDAPKKRGVDEEIRIPLSSVRRSRN